MAKSKIVEIVAVGRGEFPMDMLRYDSCWPASEVDSYVIADSLKKYGEWQVVLRKNVDAGVREPWMKPRWSSFGVQLVEYRGATSYFKDFKDRFVVPIGGTNES